MKRSSASKEVRIGVIGLGHWGPNHVRTFGQCEHARVVAAADLSGPRREHVQKLFRGLQTVADPQQVLSRKDIDAVVIATPTSTHFELARAAMRSGKHVLLEKPMCATLEQAKKLLALQKKCGVRVMMGHVFTSNRGIQYIKEGIARNDYGRLEYLDVTRTNLGPIRHDVNVIQDLAVHELSIFDYFFGSLPNWVSAVGRCLIGTSREDVAFLTLEYGKGILVHAHVSWLHPKKIRTLTLVGEKKMAVWDDTDLSEPVRVYDKGLVEEPYYDSFGHFKLLLRDKDVIVPKIRHEEPLKVQAEAFLTHVLEGGRIQNDLECGYRTMLCLKAIERSLRQEGKRIHLNKEN